MSAVDNLEENTKDVFETAVRLLITVADNILNNPNDIKFRRLKLENKNVSEKLLPAIGAIECLFEMGFDEVILLSQRRLYFH
jgi:peptide-N4-(N-acetyl-beta-glucosaminyl)asparagine amidase